VPLSLRSYEEQARDPTCCAVRQRKNHICFSRAELFLPNRLLFFKQTILVKFLRKTHYNAGFRGNLAYGNRAPRYCVRSARIGSADGNKDAPLAEIISS
jgi:hypothetical protein